MVSLSDGLADGRDVILSWWCIKTQAAFCLSFNRERASVLFKLGIALGVSGMRALEYTRKDLRSRIIKELRNLNEVGILIITLRFNFIARAR